MESIFNKPLDEEVKNLNNNLASKTTWTLIEEITTTANQNYDQTLSVTYPSNPSEIMVTLQRVSNGRTFASTVIPFGQFTNGAIYVGGQYTLYSGTYTILVNTETRLINAVVIYASSSSIEIAILANDEAIKARVFVR